MEYVNGGDCFSLLQRMEVFPEDMTRQFIAEMVCVFFFWRMPLFSLRCDFPFYFKICS